MIIANNVIGVQSSMIGEDWLIRYWGNMGQGK